MTIIAPSLMASDLLSLKEAVYAVEKAGADWLHLDIMDGHFVPNITFGPETITSLRKITNLPLDAHLMVQPAETFIEMYAGTGVDHLTIHPESTPHIHRALEYIKKLGCKAGIAINPGTSVDCILPVIDLLDLVLVMSVNPGFSGQKFINSAVAKVEKLAQIRSQQNFKIVVDGGISQSNALNLINAGADVLVAGNSIFKSDDYAKAIAMLKVS